MRKAFGIVLIVVAVLLSISMIFEIGGLIHSLISLLNDSPTSFHIGYLSGQVIGAVMFIALIYLLFRWGFKLIKASIVTKKPSDS